VANCNKIQKFNKRKIKLIAFLGHNVPLSEIFSTWSELLPGAWDLQQNSESKLKPSGTNKKVDKQYNFISVNWPTLIPAISFQSTDWAIIIKFSKLIATISFRSPDWAISIYIDRIHSMHILQRTRHFVAVDYNHIYFVCTWRKALLNELWNEMKNNQWNQI
jgi:hypothetical protein